MMKLTAKDLKEMEIIEKIIKEPENFTVTNLPDVCDSLEKQILQFLGKQMKKNPEQIVEERYQRFRRM